MPDSRDYPAFAPSGSTVSRDYPWVSGILRFTASDLESDVAEVVRRALN